MSTYAGYGYKSFVIALGYKGELIKEYFLNYRQMNSNIQVDLGTGEVVTKERESLDWQVTLVDTGVDSMTGGRVKRIQEYVGNAAFLLTYGDGVANIDVDALVRFHRSHGKLVTVTAVHPGARFGELILDDTRVVSFQEKPQISQGWINGGFFVVEPGFFELIEGDDTILERDPLEKAAGLGELMAFRHEGFWHCMDVKRDRDALEELWESGARPWVQ
jgi:glucose-1-phosphate cytidylyltransferase